MRCAIFSPPSRCVLTTAFLHSEFAVRLENPHVIEPHQVWVGVVPVGPSQVTLNSSYRNRTTDDYVMELGNTIGTLFDWRHCIVVY